jgi:anti-sigma regulatory factor (Ser/Thr protein kinase)
VTSGTFASTPREVRAARHFARSFAEGVECDPDDLSLVVSELATNACVHAKTPFTLSLARTGVSTIMVEVADEDPRSPTVSVPPLDAWSGRGLPIVVALARRWGVRILADGKVVWAELDC